MPESIFVFEFGTNEEAAQQARHKVDAWKQGFRLGSKMLLKFEREGSKAEQEAAQGESGRKKPARGKNEDEKAKQTTSIRLLVRLRFSDHEKLSHQRWLDRIPVEEPFKSAKSRMVRTGDPEFPKTAELFDSLA
jgi:hypothetical protein